MENFRENTQENTQNSNGQSQTIGVGGGTVSGVRDNGLNELISEFKSLENEKQATATTNANNSTAIDEVKGNLSDLTFDEPENTSLIQEGEKYTLSQEENDQIEKYLLGADEDDEDVVEYVDEEEDDETQDVETEEEVEEIEEGVEEEKGESLAEAEEEPPIIIEEDDEDFDFDDEESEMDDSFDDEFNEDNSDDQFDDEDDFDDEVLDDEDTNDEALDEENFASDENSDNEDYTASEENLEDDSKDQIEDFSEEDELDAEEDNSDTYNEDEEDIDEDENDEEYADYEDEDVEGDGEGYLPEAEDYSEDTEDIENESVEDVENEDSVTESDTQDGLVGDDAEADATIDNEENVINDESEVMGAETEEANNQIQDNVSENNEDIDDLMLGEGEGRVDEVSESQQPKVVSDTESLVQTPTQAQTTEQPVQQPVQTTEQPQMVQQPVQYATEQPVQQPVVQPMPAVQTYESEQSQTATPQPMVNQVAPEPVQTTEPVQVTKPVQQQTYTQPQMVEQPAQPQVYGQPQMVAQPVQQPVQTTEQPQMVQQPVQYATEQPVQQPVAQPEQAVQTYEPEQSQTATPQPMVNQVAPEPVQTTEQPQMVQQPVQYATEQPVQQPTESQYIVMAEPQQNLQQSTKEVDTFATQSQPNGYEKSPQTAVNVEDENSPANTITQTEEVKNTEKPAEETKEVRYFAPNVTSADNLKGNIEVVPLGIETEPEKENVYINVDEPLDSGFVDEEVEDENTTFGVTTIVQTPSVDEVDSRSAELKELEERLYTRIMSKLANMNVSSADARSVISSETSGVELPEEEVKLDLSAFKGKVETFIPLESIPQATWEDVVKRKGHHTYHVTCAKGGGYFIKKAKTPNPYAFVELKEEALEVAKCYAKREKAELKIHDAKGVIEQSMSFGKEKKKPAKKS